MTGDVYIDGSFLGVATNVQMPKPSAGAYDKWLYNADGEVRGRYFIKPLSELSNVSANLPISDFEFATPEDNTPEKLAKRLVNYE